MSAVEAVQEEEPNSWWATLKHQGVLLSPIVLEEIFPDGPPSIDEREYETLRRSYKSFRNDSDELYDWLDVVLEDLLGHSKSWWVKETNVPAEFRRGDLRPNRVLLNQDDEARAMVWIDTDRVTDNNGEPGRIGIYSGKRTYAKFARLLRETGTDIGILTNGHQFRVIHATLDHESWTEWDAQAWFQGGEGRRALRGFYGLLSDDILPRPSDEEEESLIGRIKASRDRQADLSDVMGTQVREAVELLLKDLDAILMEMSEEEREEILAPLAERDLSQRDELRARYQAAIRIVMRLVVALYAESRELFPKDNPVYYNSYSVEGLFRDLREARIEEGEDTLEKQYSAWPRLQALSRLVYYGSPHSDVPIRAYGGRLFRPPGEDGDDDVLAGLAVFENADIRLSDATILEVLEKLKIAEFESGGQRRTGPVDFSDLRTEYIGMMYEGLLDYELREATEDDGAILFLNIGDQPALPFNVLENLDDSGLENLVDNLKDDASDSFLADDEVSEGDFEEDELDEDEEEAADDDEEKKAELDEFDNDLEARVHQWAKRVVEETGVYMPHFNTVRAMDPTTQEKYENKAARRVVDRIIRPGGTYLVSHSGTRKSTGTFYTPPGLAVPTVHRTLEPLVYEGNGDTKIPKEPEEILDLQICDPAMGSGTFPVAALRYLTDTIKESFEEHVFPEVDEGDPIAAPLGTTAKGYLNERLLEIRKGENEDWQERLEMQLKRSVVERCIYGVDINPLAVELGKLSLWIETLDPMLPFTFLDHKLRVGNSLIGAWLHEFEDYPVAAWNRDGANDERDKRIRSFRNNEMKEQMQNYINNAQYETHWFETGPEVNNLIGNVRDTFEQLHESVNESERERLYREEFQENEDVEKLRHLMDRWCSIWFWPLDSDESPVLDPETFYNTIEDAETDPIVEELSNRRKLQFFHWELEFPDVFSGDKTGFDAVIGNPPWDKQKPNSLEFFTRYRPEFRTYGKQEAEQVREQLFTEQPQIEKDWWDNVGYYKGLSNYVKYSSDPWDVPLARGKKSKQLADNWQKLRDSREVEPPFRWQGSADLNSYKLFTELFHFITEEKGRVGAVLPAAIYSDYGNQELRSLLLDNCSWEWAYSFENRKGIFSSLYYRFKFCICIFERKNATENLKCRFMVQDTSDWNQKEIPEHIVQSRDQIYKFSPDVQSILEVNGQKDVDILNRMYEAGTMIGDTDVEYSTDLHMTGDSELFKTRESLEEEGYEILNHGVAQREGKTKALPLIEGRHVEEFDFKASAHIRGHGRSANWEELDWNEKRLQPQYLVPVKDIIGKKSIFDDKIGIMDIASATNVRTIKSAVFPPYPCNHAVPVLKSPSYSQEDYFALTAILNSYALDYIAKFKIQGTHASWYILESIPIPDIDDETKSKLAGLSESLHSPIPNAKVQNGELELSYPEGDTVTGPKKRMQIREEIDHIVAKLYELTDDDMEWILRPDNDDPRNLWRDYVQRLKLLGGEGRWGKIPKKELEEMEISVK